MKLTIISYSLIPTYSRLIVVNPAIFYTQLLIHSFRLPATFRLSITHRTYLPAQSFSLQILLRTVHLYNIPRLQGINASHEPLLVISPTVPTTYVMHAPHRCILTSSPYGVYTYTMYLYLMIIVHARAYIHIYQTHAHTRRSHRNCTYRVVIDVNLPHNCADLAAYLSPRFHRCAAPWARALLSTFRRGYCYEVANNNRRRTRFHTAFSTC